MTTQVQAAESSGRQRKGQILCYRAELMKAQDMAPYAGQCPM